MRLTFLRPVLLTAVVFAGIGAFLQAQTVDTGLPKVVKPKMNAPADPEAVPSADPNAIPELGARPDPNAPAKTDSNAGTGDTATETSAGPEYTGPSILSRGMNFTRPNIPSNEKFRPFVGINIFRDSGVSGAYRGPLTKPSSSSIDGAELNWGLSGQHVRRADSFQVDYRGHSSFGGNYNNQDQALSLGYSRILSRRLSATISEAAGLYANNYSLLNSVSQTDTSVGGLGLIVTPNTESFDDRTYYTSTQADLTFQKTSRLSVDVGTSVFYVKRNSSNLTSANGYQTRTDVSYRITKRTTIGPYYAYSRYLYSGTFGDSDIHTVGANYSLALNKSLQFRVRGGASRLETRGLEQVALDPAVAQILGRLVGTQRYYQASYVPDFAVDLSKSFRHSSVSASYLRGVSPGNGVILTSQRNSTSVNYTYNGIRRYGFTVSGGRDSLASAAQTIGNFSSYFARASLSRSLPHNVQALMSFDYRKLGFTAGLYSRDQYRVTLGFAFAPGMGPLKFW
jgi:hypothetical protein